MYLLYVGVTHRVAPLSVLERVHFSDEEKISALKKLKAEKYSGRCHPFNL